MQSHYISDTVWKFLNVCPDLNDQNKWAAQNETFPGTSAGSGLHSLPRHHQCRCCPCFRFSVIRIPFPHVSAFSPPPSPARHPTCSYSGKVVVQHQFRYSLWKKWYITSLLCLMSTKNVCGDCRLCPDFHTDDECWGRMVLRTGRFSSVYSMTMLWPLNYWRISAWFGERCSVAPVVEIWCGPNVQI